MDRMWFYMSEVLSGEKDTHKWSLQSKQESHFTQSKFLTQS